MFEDFLFAPDKLLKLWHFGTGCLGTWTLLF